MNRGLVFGGMTLLAACACGAGSGLASISTAAGVAIPAGWPYAALLMAGGVLVLIGIGSGVRPLAAAALGSLLIAGVLAPPSVMSDSAVHTEANLIGFGFYLLATVLLILTFIRLWRPRVGAPLLAVMAGVALSVGCTCCLTLGAVRYSALATGSVPSPVVSRLALVLLAVAMALAGFAALRRLDAAAWFVAGVLMVYPIEKAVEALVPSWQAGEASLTFLLRYPVWLTGTALILYSAFLVLTASRRPDPEAYAQRVRAAA